MVALYTRGNHKGMPLQNRRPYFGKPLKLTLMMFEPTYTISPVLLEQVKQITLLAHELNRLTLPTVVLAELKRVTRTRSAWASTTIEGNPLSLTEVRSLLKNRPQTITQSEREVWNYNAELQRLDEFLH